MKQEIPVLAARTRGALFSIARTAEATSGWYEPAV